ncbi:hypothetical protein PCASD_13221 [Puccinia coronata f. sp. avenae]|uniref:Transcription initiation factor TFIID subunit 8 n=1 Tax=Puccinia coronata f. sp. avenae TaxID=200324 RepID=A0A2N5U2D9_9BASI|nr:hypothetical protein PCASD_13221 [Puccinia coronata f. sp. avenae]
MSPETARFGLLRLISLELGRAGFTHVEHRSLVEDLEGLVCGLVDGIVQLAYELAQLSNRSRPNVRDMIAACSDQGIEVHHLLDLLSHAPTPCDRLDLEIPRARKDNPVDPTLDFLPSDPESDEEEQLQRSGADVHMAPPFALRPAAHKRHRLDSERIGGLPHLPLLPAKHAWIHTAFEPAPATVLPPKHLIRPSPPPAQPMTKLLTDEFLGSAGQDDPNTPACLGFLNRRIRDTRLVERSLTNLVQPSSALASYSSSSSSSSNPPPPVVPLPPSPPKLMLSDADIPIINFERDWYSSFQHPSH